MDTRTLTRYALISALAALVLMTPAGCARAKNISPSTPDEGTSAVTPAPDPFEDIRIASKPSTEPIDAVRAYLRAVHDAYFSLESSMVAPFVAERQWVREDAYIQLNVNEGRAIEMTLDEFLVMQAAAPGAEATSTEVTTEERWRWRYWGIETRRPSTAWATTHYRMLYTLARAGTGWVVADTQVLEQSGETTPTPLP